MARFAACLAACCLLISCTAGPGSYSALEPGQWTPQHDDNVLLEDSLANRTVRAQVSWPAVEPGTEARFPVIVFSHGAFCYPQQYRNISDFWVSRGYVVVFPNHLDSPNGGKMSPDDAQRLLSSRVRDMSLVLDSLPEIEAQLPQLAGHIDYSQFAVAGHSFGGMIAMIKSGLRMADAGGRVLTDYADPRFTAAVVMSGVGEMQAMPGMPEVERMVPDAFAGLNGPLIASGGTLDEGNVGTGEIFPWEWRMGGYTLAPPGDKYSLVLQDADHYLGGLICREDRGGPEDQDAVRIVRAVQTAFLDSYLKNDPAARKWLQTADFETLSGGRAQLNTR